MTPAQLTDFITPIIAAHVKVEAPPHFARCSCGWEVPRRHSATKRHQKHLAMKLTQHILGTDKP